MDSGPSSPPRPWTQKRSMRKISTGVVDPTGNKSNHNEEISGGNDTKSPEPSCFSTRIELVYVRPTRGPALHLNDASNSFQNSPGIENNDRTEDYSTELCHIESDDGESGLAQHKETFQAPGLNSPPQEFQNR